MLVPMTASVWRFNVYHIQKIIKKELRKAIAMYKYYINAQTDKGKYHDNAAHTTN